MKKLACQLIAGLLFLQSAQAIVVADYGTATNAPSGSWNVDWSYVYNYKTSSSVAVGSHWLLTAAHVADDGVSSTVVVNGTNYYQAEIIFHAAADDPAHTNKADLALVRFDKEFPGYYPLYTNGTFPVNQPGPGDDRLNAVLIGYGSTGAVYSASYSLDLNNAGKGVKRWGSQKVDGASSLDCNVEGTTGMTYNDGINLMFTLSDTTYEAGAGVGDSGGGTFVNEGGTWKLAGINTQLYGTSATNVTGTFAVSVPAYASWITTVISDSADLDGDGLPNYWEQQYSTTTTGLVASTDSDSDGFSNYQEYVADTNPTNSASFLEMSGFSALTNQTVWFNGSTGREYQVFYTTNDLAGTNLSWTAANSPVAGTGTNSSITVTNTEEKAFYRLQATLP
jgi:hypothetical protein